MNPERLSGIKVSYATVPFKHGMGMCNRRNSEGWSSKKVSHATVPLKLDLECGKG
jgi:hypothetical protein